MPKNEARTLLLDDVERYQAESESAWQRLNSRWADSRSGEYTDLSEITDPLRAYIDARIKKAFAEKTLYGQVVL